MYADPRVGVTSAMAVAGSKSPAHSVDTLTARSTWAAATGIAAHQPTTSGSADPSGNSLDTSLCAAVPDLTRSDSPDIQATLHELSHLRSELAGVESALSVLKGPADRSSPTYGRRSQTVTASSSSMMATLRTSVGKLPVTGGKLKAALPQQAYIAPNSSRSSPSTRRSPVQTFQASGSPTVMAGAVIAGELMTEASMEAVLQVCCYWAHLTSGKHICCYSQCSQWLASEPQRHTCVIQNDGCCYAAS